METSREPAVICKPALDHREYCHLRLGPRGELMAVLISDPETDKAAAAMDVGVGHSSDAASLPGLAHFNFCEHACSSSGPIQVPGGGAPTRPSSASRAFS